MKRTILIAALMAAALSAGPGMAQQQAAAPDVAGFDKQVAQMQQNMQRMQEQMDKIRQTQDPQERQKLLQEHWETMRNNMAQMHEMWGPGMGCCAGGPMMGGGMRGGHMMGGPMMGGPMMGWQDYSKLTPDQMKQRQYMMDRYMGMQQQMMDHMMQHQNYMWMQPPR